MRLSHGSGEQFLSEQNTHQELEGERGRERGEEEARRGKEEERMRELVGLYYLLGAHPNNLTTPGSHSPGWQIGDKRIGGKQDLMGLEGWDTHLLQD